MLSNGGLQFIQELHKDIEEKKKMANKEEELKRMKLEEDKKRAVILAEASRYAREEKANRMSMANKKPFIGSASPSSKYNLNSSRGSNLNLSSSAMNLTLLPKIDSSFGPNAKKEKAPSLSKFSSAVREFNIQAALREVNTEATKPLVKPKLRAHFETPLADEVPLMVQIPQIKESPKQRLSLAFQCVFKAASNSLPPNILPSNSPSQPSSAMLPPLPQLHLDTPKSSTQLSNGGRTARNRMLDQISKPDVKVDFKRSLEDAYKDLRKAAKEQGESVVGQINKRIQKIKPLFKKADKEKCEKVIEELSRIQKLGQVFQKHSMQEYMFTKRLEDEKKKLEEEYEMRTEAGSILRRAECISNNFNGIGQAISSSARGHIPVRIISQKLWEMRTTSKSQVEESTHHLKTHTSTDRSAKSSSLLLN